jgi:TPR repeat protein
MKKIRIRQAAFAKLDKKIICAFICFGLIGQVAFAAKPDKKDKVKDKTNNLVDRCKKIVKYKVVEYEVAKSQYDLCVMYHNGDGVEQNYEKAIKKAEDDNFCRICFENYTKYPQRVGPVSVETQYDFGVRCYNGKVVEQNYKETFNWFKEVEQNYKEAFNWFKRAAQQGSVPAKHYLGMMYYNGEEVKQSYKKAFNWYKKSAEQGFAQAQYNLALMYYNGEGVEQNYKEALNWFKKAAQQGDAAAQCNLGVMYHNGKVVEQNYEEALNWFKKAAQQGFTPAKYYLGMMYYNGEGVKQNYKEAMNWFKKVAEQGHPYAKTALTKITKILESK